MLKVNISNNEDMQEGLKLLKRQQYEDERKKRIFNAKQRLFGIDQDYIERQVAEKAKRDQVAAECQKRYNDQIRIQDMALKAKDHEQEKRQRIINSDLNFYRCRFQRLDQRREFDLNDPNALKNAKPLRASDDDVNLGLASCQIFAGEDLGFRERRKRQFEQQRAWLDQQVQERQQAEQSKRTVDEKWRTSMQERDNRLEDMVVSEKRVKDELIHSIRQYNMSMARNKSMQRQRDKQDKIDDDMAEIYNMLTSDMLTENPDVAQSRLDPKKKIAFQYRGMTPQELATFREGQENQRVAAREREAQIKLMNTQWEQYALNMDRELKLKDLELAEREKKVMNALFEFNIKLAREKEVEKQEEARKAAGVAITDEFYQKFNTGTR